MLNALTEHSPISMMTLFRVYLLHPFSSLRLNGRFVLLLCAFFSVVAHLLHGVNHFYYLILQFLAFDHHHIKQIIELFTIFWHVILKPLTIVWFKHIDRFCYFDFRRFWELCCYFSEENWVSKRQIVVSNQTWRREKKRCLLIYNWKKKLNGF